MQYQVSNRQSDIDFECGRDGTKRILQNVHNLISIIAGEIPYDRMRGVHRGIYDLPFSEINSVLLPVIDAALAYEPRATAEDAEAALDEDGHMFFTVTVNIKEE